MYKTNLYHEPIKRVNLDTFNVRDFQVDINKFVVVVKTDGGYLNFETTTIQIYVAVEYPNILEKVADLPIYINIHVRSAFE